MKRLILLLFILSVFIPVEFYTMAGSVRIEAYRIVLAIVLLFALLNLRSVLRQANLADVLLFVLLGLAFFSFWHNHSLQKAVESTGLYAIETLGAFYLARLFVQTPQTYYRVNIIFVTIIALLIGLTLYESFAKHRILHELAERITGHQSLDYRLYTYDYVRTGIMRATSVFAHPILFGTLTALFFPFITLLVLRSKDIRHFGGFLGVFTSMIMTLSSAPLLSLIFQASGVVLVKLWHNARNLWFAAFFGFLTFAMFLQAASNRGFFGILISYLTFNPNTGYFRMLQWEYSMDDILANPILGIAHNDWTRPYWKAWMGDSIDSFWLLLALQHGLFAGAILLIACLYALFSVLNRLPHVQQEHQWLATSWLLAFMSLVLIGFTVDYFGKLQPMFFFFLGASGWILNTMDQDLQSNAALVADSPERDGS